MSKVRRALISVSDKTGLVEFARGLSEMGVAILSTGGTASTLEKNGIPVVGVSDVTKFPEMLDGRVKTLHPAIHGGLLAMREKQEHMEAIKKHGIEPIDMVVVNLYPFEATVAKPDVKIEDAIENIDIGGPSMIRSAAKNNSSVTVVVNPAQYEKILAEMKENDGKVSDETRKSCALEAFRATARYDSAIASYLGKKFNNEILPKNLTLSFEKLSDLRYGENPHQKAAFYKDLFDQTPLSVAAAEKMHGKEISYCNVLDLDAALAIVSDFEKPTAAVIKHTNPSGVASADTIAEAFRIAYNADSLSAFGCVVGLNRQVDLETAKEISSHFVEAVIAPGYDPDAEKLLEEKKSIRLLRTNMPIKREEGRKFMAKVKGGLLVQTDAYTEIDKSKLKVVTKRSPTQEEMDAMIFGVKVCRHIKSNTILLVKGERTVGVGAGQMSRVDSATIAGMKAGPEAKGSVLISDAFFPFRDGIDAAAKVGASVIIQPGGSVRDDEAIAAANEYGMAMVFSGLRLFKH
ncbi:MAG: bifunctional phosphoribosylaminoimidazolecarboxamide formyltransferase/IMP cyclohydrolase [Thermoplasmata archaeon]|nr:bifunctional phosphoribosylaminoimidazolecarboxamide formyltransferase/IMP cyclohydrolase [Thermoplasmata archaeon]MCJ7561530.1 bifunctional phosphoribosylaminoimidazolecarboxamide formyltransferase/IMP cyclohydrolase [Thermoplasmata archaeon]TFG70013.1 MAG: bifunctional phosphoribosylaminoimidazolecarboxamide formyltransferase/IMP cyclohydrolase [Methanomassiliicoccus sp.]